jgi:DNA repair exonuclease SbcCD ATPase subunit
MKAAVRQTVPVKNATRALVKRLETQKKEAVEKNLPEAEAIAKLEDGVRKLSESKENDRQQTLLKLNDLVKDAQQRREELASSAELKKQLAGLKNLEQGAAEKLTQALKSGNLEKAIEEIKKLQKLAAEGKLDAEQQQALARQLQQLQQQLAQSAEAQQKQAEQLKQQIAAQRRAGNQEAADKLQEQLDKIASQQNQHGNLSEMAAQLQSATKSLSEGNGEEAAEALAQLGQQLSGMQENLQELESLDLALAGVSECKQAMACQTCQGDGCDQCQPGSEWKKSYGELSSEKKRGGGKGIGVGLGPGLGDETDPDGKFYDSAVKQQPGLGRAAVVGEADGPNRKGRVQEEIQAEFTEGVQKASDALSDQRLPRDYRDHAQKYFDILREGKP